MTATTVGLTGEVVRAGDSTYEDSPARLEPAVLPLPRRHRVLLERAGRDQRRPVGPRAGHCAPRAQRPAQPRGLVLGRRRSGDRRQPDEEHHHRPHCSHRNGRDRAHPAGDGHRAGPARLRRPHRLRRWRRTRRRHPGRRLRAAHPQHGNGLRQPDRRGRRRRRRRALREAGPGHARTTIPTCCGPAAAAVAATSGSPPPTPSRCTNSPTSRS